MLTGCQPTSDEEFRIVSSAEVADSDPAVVGPLSKSPTAEGDVLDAGDVSPEDVIEPATLGRVKLLLPVKTFSAEGSQRALRVSFDDFDLERVLNVVVPPPNIVDHFPDWLSMLEGKRVRVRGFMVPSFREEGLSTFVLARDTKCCFGVNGKIYHLVDVALSDGVTTDYIHMHPFDVEGIFHIRPDVDGNELWQLYQIEDAVIIDP